MLLALAGMAWAEECALTREEGEGLPTLRARCAWDLPPEAVAGLLADFGAHDEIWESVASAEVVGREGGWTKVLHTHRIPGLEDRVVLLLWRQLATPLGVRFEWRMAADQPATGGVVPLRDEGWYEVRGRPEGGTELLAELNYDPGGSFPTWIARSTQELTARLMLDELRAAAAREAPPP